MKKFNFVITAALTMLFTFSCGSNAMQSLKREELFTLEIGRMEDQIDLFNLEGRARVNKTRITMRNGLFYISDGNGEKVVRYTSFGDLLFMIYNEETNPPPISLRTSSETNGLVTRWAVSYPLREPGELTVDSRKHIYVEDLLPPERHGHDPDTGVLFDSIVLHFDADGRFVEYLGKEGIGGTPFPRITGIFSSAGDDLAVVCRLLSGWNVYWFDSQGVLFRLIRINGAELPIPEGREVFPSMDSIHVAPDARNLYLKIDYYRNTYDQSTNTRTGSVMDSSVIWTMDIEDGDFLSSLEVPFYEWTFFESRQRVTEELMYSVTGVMRNNSILLSVPLEDGYSLLLLNIDSNNRKQAFISVSDNELQYNALNLSEDGILIGLLATDWNIKVVWWRLDNLFGDFR